MTSHRVLIQDLPKASQTSLAATQKERKPTYISGTPGRQHQQQQQPPDLVNAVLQHRGLDSHQLIAKVSLYLASSIHRQRRKINVAANYHLEEGGEEEDEQYVRAPCLSVCLS